MLPITYTHKNSPIAQTDTFQCDVQWPTCLIKVRKVRNFAPLEGFLCGTHDNTFLVCLKYICLSLVLLLSSVSHSFTFLFFFLSVGGMVSVRFHYYILDRWQKKKKKKIVKVIATISELPITGLCDDVTNY